jgi:hypothetical protein
MVLFKAKTLDDEDLPKGQLEESTMKQETNATVGFVIDIPSGY